MANFTQKAKKNYIGGSAKLREFDNGGEVIDLDLKLEDVNALPVNEKGYVKLRLSRKDAVDQYGNHYSIYENDYVPQKKEGGGTTSGPVKETPKGPSVRGPKEKLPF